MFRSASRNATSPLSNPIANAATLSHQATQKARPAPTLISSPRRSAIGCLEGADTAVRAVVVCPMLHTRTYPSSPHDASMVPSADAAMSWTDPIWANGMEPSRSAPVTFHRLMAPSLPPETMVPDDVHVTAVTAASWTWPPPWNFDGFRSPEPLDDHRSIVPASDPC